MTTPNLQRLRELALQYADLTDPADPYPAELVGDLARGCLSLIDEIERLTKDAQSARLDHMSTIGQSAEVEAELRQQIAAMTAARDEACEIAKPPLLLELSNATTAAAYGPPEDRGEAGDWKRNVHGAIQRLEALRKVGGQP
jgi:hypothetical protein